MSYDFKRSLTLIVREFFITLSNRFETLEVLALLRSSLRGPDSSLDLPDVLQQLQNGRLDDASLYQFLYNMYGFLDRHQKNSEAFLWHHLENINWSLIPVPERIHAFASLPGGVMGQRFTSLYEFMQVINMLISLVLSCPVSMARLEKSGQYVVVFHAGYAHLAGIFPADLIYPTLFCSSMKGFGLENGTAGSFLAFSSRSPQVVFGADYERQGDTFSIHGEPVGQIVPFAEISSSYQEALEGATDQELYVFHKPIGVEHSLESFVPGVYYGYTAEVLVFHEQTIDLSISDFYVEHLYNEFPARTNHFKEIQQLLSNPSSLAMRIHWQDDSYSVNGRVLGKKVSSLLHSLLKRYEPSKPQNVITNDDIRLTAHGFGYAGDNFGKFWKDLCAELDVFGCSFERCGRGKYAVRMVDYQWVSATPEPVVVQG